MPIMDTSSISGRGQEHDLWGSPTPPILLVVTCPGR